MIFMTLLQTPWPLWNCWNYFNIYFCYLGAWRGSRKKIRKFVDSVRSPTLRLL